MKTILISTSLFLSCLMLQAQNFSVGAKTSYMQLFNSGGIKNLGLGVQVDYSGMGEKTAMVFSFNNYFSYKDQKSTYGYLIGEQVGQTSIDIPYHNKIAFHKLSIGGKRMFVGNTSSTFKLYAIVEAGLLLASTKTKLDDHSPKYYTVLDQSNDLLHSYTVNIGLGTGLKFSGIELFLDTRVNIPRDDSEQLIKNEIQTSLSIDAGVKFDLGGSSVSRSSKSSKKKPNMSLKQMKKGNKSSGKYNQKRRKKMWGN